MERISYVANPAVMNFGSNSSGKKVVGIDMAYQIRPSWAQFAPSMWNHNDGLNVVYWDGHARWFHLAEIERRWAAGGFGNWNFSMLE